MTTLFSDGFESSDFSAWTGTNNDGTGGILTVSSGSAHGGTKKADMKNGNGGEAGQGAYCYADFSASGTGITNLDTWINIRSTSGAGRLRLLQLSQTSTSIVRLEYTNGGYQIVLHKQDGSDATQALSTGLSATTWQEIQLVYDRSGANPIATCYLDGLSVATITDTTSGSTYTIGRVLCLSYEQAATASVEAWHDDVSVIDTAPAGGTTYTDAGQATAPWTISGADTAIFVETGGASSANTASGADAWTMADAGQALSAWSSGALDVMTMTDAGGGVLIAVASGTDGSVPAVELPYQGDTTVYDSATSTGSISGATILSGDVFYDTAGATGTTSGTTIMPAETIL